MYRLKLLFVVLALLLISCGDDSPTKPEPEPTTGAVEVTTSTTGDDIDGDGYTVAAANVTSDIDPNDTTVLTDLSEGSVDVELSGIASNCSVSGDNPQNLSVTAGDTTSTMFDVECAPVANNQIVFQGDFDANIYLMNADGTNTQMLTDNSTGDDNEKYPAISNDGQKIVFSSDENNSSSEYDIYTIRVDGTDVQQLTTSGTGGQSPVWAPDDSKIAFYDDRSGNDEIYVINNDGSNEIRLTNNTDTDQRPNWSPDGQKIAFASNRDGDLEIYTVNPDGSGITKITDNSSLNDTDPSWSPGGSKFVFIRSSDVFTMNSDGLNIQQVTNTSAAEFSPSWSPDGSKIVFQSDRDGDFEIYSINADGSGSASQLTDGGGYKCCPFWSPVQ